MDTPESPTQSPQSPDEEKGLSDTELLDSPESPTLINRVSDSELLNDEEGERDAADSDFEDEGRAELSSEAPEDISDQEDDKPIHAGYSPQGRNEEEEVLETPRSPNLNSPEQERPLSPTDQDDNGEEGSGMSPVERREEEDDDEDERRQRRRKLVSDLKEESPSVSRDLDEHELDYDEEVPEEPSSAAPEDEDLEKATVAEDGDEVVEDKDEKSRKKERKPILPPDQTDAKKYNEMRGQGRPRRDSFRDKKKDEDDGEIDEGEIDVSVFI